MDFSEEILGEAESVEELREIVWKLKGYRAIRQEGGGDASEVDRIIEEAEKLIAEHTPPEDYTGD